MRNLDRELKMNTTYKLMGGVNGENASSIIDQKNSS
jgi:hypothetical protein